MVPLALIEGQWKYDGAGTGETLTGSNHCKGGCANHSHKALPDVKQLASLLTETTETERNTHG